MTRTFQTAVIACALLVAAAPARAREAVPPKVQELIKQMMVDYNTGDFDAALAKATEAYRLKPLPALLFNIGQFHKALHNWERAEFFFHRYLNERPDAPNREQVEKLIAEVQQKASEAAATPAPAPAAPVIVESTPTATPASAPASTPPSAPATATSGSVSTEAPSHSHVLAYSLIGGAALLGIGAGLLSIPVVNMNNINNQVKAGTGNLAYSKVQSADSQGATFQGVAIGVGIAAVLCAGSVYFVW